MTIPVRNFAKQFAERLMTLIDEFTRKRLAIRIARRINAIGAIETSANAVLAIRSAPPEGTLAFIRSDDVRR